MGNNCQKIQEQILELIAGALSAEKADELQHHIERCPACSEYLKAMQADDKLLGEFAEAAQPSVASVEKNVIESLNRGTAERGVKSISIWRKIMKTRMTKIAAAAVIIIAAFIGIHQLSSSTNEIAIAKLLHGLQTHSFNDGSTVKLAEGAEIGLYDSSEKRGFEHLAGEVEVTVAKGKGEFVVVTSFGDVKALGTVFRMDLIESDSIKVLAVNVDEGVVEVSNEKGTVVIQNGQGATVEKDSAPYDFRQDKSLPSRLIERINSMLKAMETGDKNAYIANYNVKAFYDLAKGNIEFSEHRDWFSGMSDEDAKRFKKGLAGVNSIDEMLKILASGVNMSGDVRKLYVRSVMMDNDGKHAMAMCVRFKSRNQSAGYTPQWTFFDGDWWQTDD